MAQRAPDAVDPPRRPLEDRPIEALARTMPEDPPRPRLLACDIDGTLLDATGGLHPAVREAIRAVADSGVHVILATGRSPWGGVARIVEELGLAGPQVTMQGALISDPLTGRVARARPLPIAVYLDALRFAEELEIEPVVALMDGHRAARLPQDVEFVVQGAAADWFLPEADLRSLADASPMRVFLPTNPDRHRQVRAAAAVWFARRASLVWSDLTGVELLAPYTNKGKALAWMAALDGLGLDEVAAVGDGTNDIEMLLAAGQSAAMGDAAALVRGAADIVVPSSERDGIVDALDWFFPDLGLGRELRGRVFRPRLLLPVDRPT